MIKDIRLFPLFNSRGEQTIKAKVFCEHGCYSSCSATGASKSRYEAVELPLKKVMQNFTKMKRILPKREQDYKIFDAVLERLGGRNFAKIGGNLAIALSQACMKAAAGAKGVYSLLNDYPKYLPYPLGNAIGGGAHGGGTDIQEFLALPLKAKSIAEAVQTNFSIWKEVGKAIRKKGFFIGRNDEGAWVSRLNDLKTLELVAAIAEEHDARVGLDFAASQLYSRGQYKYLKLGKKFSYGEQLDFVKHLVETYKLAYVEDPFQQNDFSSFSELRRRCKCIICGDDLYASHTQRLAEGIKKKSGNAIIIKPNQCGTVSRALETIKLAKSEGFMHIVSHRSGDTCDTFISDLAVGTEAPLIKCGIAGGERVAKANRLIEIWHEIAETRKPAMAALKIK